MSARHIVQQEISGCCDEWEDLGQYNRLDAAREAVRYLRKRDPLNVARIVYLVD